MSTVQIDDFECSVCGKLTMAELNIKTGKYTCLRCLNKKVTHTKKQDCNKCIEEIYAETGRELRKEFQGMHKEFGGVF
jgi:hypothetical protein